MNFSSIVRRFVKFAHPQADEPERQQAAQFGAAFGGIHHVGRQGIGAFQLGLRHAALGCSAL